MKIVTVVGARPQFVKAATISKEFLGFPAVEEILVHTGQHYNEQMSEVFFKELGIPTPKYNLAVGSRSHGAQTGRMMDGIEHILKEEKPSCVLVYGDTNSTLAGALAAVKLHIPVAHVEAGLRSYNRMMPEEINRVVTDHISTHLFAPSPLAKDNLVREGLDSDRISITGDVMYDATLTYGELGKRVGSCSLSFAERQEYILATVHRAENTDDQNKLRGIFQALCKIAENHLIIVPIHPRTKQALDNIGLLNQVRNTLYLIEPVGYLDMLFLEKYAKLIVTDSGGVQKEAYYQSVPSLVLRTETEWPELVETGWSQLVDPAAEDAITTVIQSVLNLGAGVRQQKKPELFGDGRAAHKVVCTILEKFQ